MVATCCNCTKWRWQSGKVLVLCTMNQGYIIKRGAEKSIALLIEARWLSNNYFNTK